MNINSLVLSYMTNHIKSYMDSLVLSYIIYQSYIINHISEMKTEKKKFSSYIFHFISHDAVEKEERSSGTT